MDGSFLRDEELPEVCLEGTCTQHLALTAVSTFRNWVSAAEAIMVVLTRDGLDARNNKPRGLTHLCKATNRNRMTHISNAPCTMLPLAAAMFPSVPMHGNARFPSTLTIQ